MKDSRWERHPILGIQFPKMEMTPTSHTPAHSVTATVAPFRAWRGSQLTVARRPMGATIEARDYPGFTV